MARLVPIQPETYIRALCDHASARGYWPSALELWRGQRARLGGRCQVIRELKALRDAGLIRLDGSGGERYWIPTPDGYARVGRAEITIADHPSRLARRRGLTGPRAVKRRRQARIAAARQLDQSIRLLPANHDSSDNATDDTIEILT